VRTLIILLLLCSTAVGQEYLPYKEIEKFRKPDGQLMEPGTYFVLVTADWCIPCKKLKEELDKFDRTYYVVDYDKQLKIRNKLLDPREGIPKLIRYDCKENGCLPTTYNKAVPLKDFLVELKKPQSQPQPMEDRVLSRLFEQHQQRMDSRFREWANTIIEAIKQFFQNARLNMQQFQLDFKAWRSEVRENWTPIKNLVERFNNLYDSLIRSVWKLGLLILSIIILVSIIWAIVGRIIAWFGSIGDKFVVGPTISYVRNLIRPRSPD
jgi:thiol-disulfide isomerase/thioredoxin